MSGASDALESVPLVVFDFQRAMERAPCPIRYPMSAPTTGPLSMERLRVAKQFMETQLEQARAVQSRWEQPGSVSDCMSWLWTTVDRFEVLVESGILTFDVEMPRERTAFFLTYVCAKYGHRKLHAVEDNQLTLVNVLITLFAWPKTLRPAHLNSLPMLFYRDAVLQRAVIMQADSNRKTLGESGGASLEFFTAALANHQDAVNRAAIDILLKAEATLWRDFMVACATCLRMLLDYISDAFSSLQANRSVQGQVTDALDTRLTPTFGTLTDRTAGCMSTDSTIEKIRDAIQVLLAGGLPPRDRKEYDERDAALRCILDTAQPNEVPMDKDSLLRLRKLAIKARELGSRHDSRTQEWFDVVRELQGLQTSLLAVKGFKSGWLAELDNKLESDKAQREQQRQIAEERAKRRIASEAQGKRLKAAFHAASAWPGEARARGEKPTAQGFFAWAERWVELGKSLQSLARGRLRLEFVAAASGVSELEYAARILLLAMDGSQEQLSEALEKLHTDPVARRCFLWLPFISDCLWPEGSECAEPPEGTTQEDMLKAEEAFGGKPLSKQEIGDPCIEQPRSAAELRQWIIEQFVTLEMSEEAQAVVAMMTPPKLFDDSDKRFDGLGSSSGDTVKRAWDYAEYSCGLKGYPPRPTPPPNGWTFSAERDALDKLRHWLDSNDSDDGERVGSMPNEMMDDAEADLLKRLWNAADREEGIAIIDLPDDLRDEALLSDCHGQQLIEFIRRNHCHVGGGIHQKLVLERGWNVAQLNQPKRKPVWQLLREAMSEQVSDEIRLRVRLSNHGCDVAAKLARQARATNRGTSKGDDSEADTKLCNETEVVVTAGDLWRALTEGKEVGVAVSAISIEPPFGPNVAQPTFPQPTDQEKWDTLDRALALCDAEGGDRADAMRKLIARVALARGVDRRQVINLPLADFVAAAASKTEEARDKSTHAVDLANDGRSVASTNSLYVLGLLTQIEGLRAFVRLIFSIDNGITRRIIQDEEIHRTAMNASELERALARADSVARGLPPAREPVTLPAAGSLQDYSWCDGLRSKPSDLTELLPITAESAHHLVLNLVRLYLEAFRESKIIATDNVFDVAAWREFWNTHPLKELGRLPEFDEGWLSAKCRAEHDAMMSDIHPERTRSDASENRKKRSTTKGEARRKIIAGLTKHHRYEDGSALNQEPIQVNNFAATIGVAPSGVSAFLNEHLDGYDGYRAACRERPKLVVFLRLINDEVKAKHTFGHNLPGEGGREDD